jgi:Breast carcinoma amplified sequence 2 (BCAS2)
VFQIEYSRVQKGRNSMKEVHTPKDHQNRPTEMAAELAPLPYGGEGPSAVAVDLVARELESMQRDGECESLHELVPQEELPAVRAGAAAEAGIAALDTARLRCPPERPEGTESFSGAEETGKEDSSLWSVRNALAQAEHQRLRGLNIYLGHTAAAQDQWLLVERQLRDEEELLRRQVEEEREATALLNAEREAEQRRCAEALQALRHKWRVVSDRNVALERECARLESLS